MFGSGDTASEDDAKRERVRAPLCDQLARPGQVRFGLGQAASVAEGKPELAELIASPAAHEERLQLDALAVRPLLELLPRHESMMIPPRAGVPR